MMKKTHAPETPIQCDFVRQFQQRLWPAAEDAASGQGGGVGIYHALTMA